MISLQKNRAGLAYRVLSSFMVISFVLTTVIPPSHGQMVTQTLLNMPIPGTMVSVSEGFTPAIIRGMSIYPDNPLMFDFIVDRGDSGLSGVALKDEASDMIKYFLASLTVPEDELWVNLSPYEKDRILGEGLGRTAMGRDLLAQDYVLKQVTASLMYPEDELGETFWERVYEKAYEEHGITDIPVDTFNKVWIIPEEAIVYEHESSAYVLGSHLKVMLEEDYIAMEHADRRGLIHQTQDKGMINHAPTHSNITTSVIRDILLPAIEREVNEGKNFAKLRQVYNAMILAAWYKRNLRESLLGQVYMDQNKTAGVETDDKHINQKIYDQYIESFKKGVYDYIKEDYDPATQQIVPRKYFSGGEIYQELFDSDSAVLVEVDRSTLPKLSFDQQATAARLIQGEDELWLYGINFMEMNGENGDGLKLVKKDVESRINFDVAMTVGEMQNVVAKIQSGVLMWESARKIAVDKGNVFIEEIDSYDDNGTDKQLDRLKIIIREFFDTVNDPMFNEAKKDLNLRKFFVPEIVLKEKIQRWIKLFTSFTETAVKGYLKKELNKDSLDKKELSPLLAGVIERNNEFSKTAEIVHNALLKDNAMMASELNKSLEEVKEMLDTGKISEYELKEVAEEIKKIEGILKKSSSGKLTDLGKRDVAMLNLAQKQEVLTILRGVDSYFEEHKPVGKVEKYLKENLKSSGVYNKWDVEEPDYQIQNKSLMQTGFKDVLWQDEDTVVLKTPIGVIKIARSPLRHTDGFGEEYMFLLFEDFPQMLEDQQTYQRMALSRIIKNIQSLSRDVKFLPTPDSKGNVSTKSLGEIILLWRGMDEKEKRVDQEKLHFAAQRIIKNLQLGDVLVDGLVDTSDPRLSYGVPVKKIVSLNLKDFLMPDFWLDFLFYGGERKKSEAKWGWINKTVDKLNVHRGVLVKIRKRIKELKREIGLSKSSVESAIKSPYFVAGIGLQVEKAEFTDIHLFKMEIKELEKLKNKLFLAEEDFLDVFTLIQNVKKENLNNMAMLAEKEQQVDGDSAFRVDLSMKTEAELDEDNIIKLIEGDVFLSEDEVRGWSAKHDNNGEVIYHGKGGEVKEWAGDEEIVKGQNVFFANDSSKKTTFDDTFLRWMKDGDALYEIEYSDGSNAFVFLDSVMKTTPADDVAPFLKAEKGATIVFMKDIFPGTKSNAKAIVYNYKEKTVNLFWEYRDLLTNPKTKKPYISDVILVIPPKEPAFKPYSRLKLFYRKAVNAEVKKLKPGDVQSKKAFLSEVTDKKWWNDDFAMKAIEQKDVNPLGGIDLNPAMLNLQIKRDGSGVPLPMPMQDVDLGMRVDGFVPIIFKAVPVPSMLPRLGLSESDLKRDYTHQYPSEGQSLPIGEMSFGLEYREKFYREFQAEV